MNNKGAGEAPETICEVICIFVFLKGVVLQIYYFQSTLKPTKSDRSSEGIISKDTLFLLVPDV